MGVNKKRLEEISTLVGLIQEVPMKVGGGGGDKCTLTGKVGEKRMLIVNIYISY